MVSELISGSRLFTVGCRGTIRHGEKRTARSGCKGLRAGSVGAGKVFVDYAPVFALFGEDVGAAAVDFAAPAKLHGPVKGGDGGCTVDGDVRLFDVIDEFGGALAIVDKGLAESGEAANAFVLRSREAYEAAVKHLQRTGQIAVVDGAGLCAFELKDLLTGGFCHGTPPGSPLEEEAFPACCGQARGIVHPAEREGIRTRRGLWRAYGARELFGQSYPTLTGWANVWHAYGVEETPV